jgi:SWIM zinc finger
MNTSGQRTYEVPSFSHELIYIIRQSWAGEWSCSCPHWQYRLAPIGGYCKHILTRMAQEDPHGDAA